MSTLNRRYDIDWVRVIAIGLLLVYHVAIGFQSWGILISFITTGKPWESLWLPMAMLNVWRIPLLFFVSGMGVYFAIQNRTWSQLLMERTGRILIPFLAGIVLIVPLHLFIQQYYYEWKINYIPNPGHLWFLGNIFAYVLIFLPLFVYLKRNENGKIVSAMKRIFSSPAGLIPVFAVFIMEVLLVKPFPFEMYAMTWHGFWIGLAAFFFGFCFVLSGAGFWQMILKWRWVFLAAAVIFFIVRVTQFKPFAPGYLISLESNLWILSVFAFGYKYLNRPSKTLSYLSQAAYPVYILHMVFLYLGSLLIFPTEIPLQVQFVFVLVFTIAGCLGMYEFVIRRVKFIRPLFGLKMK